MIDEVLKKKYLREGETSWKDLCQRIASIIDKDRPKLAQDLYDLMIDKKYSPGGSVLANIGTNLSLSNCYFIPIEDDSIEGIFDFMKHAARTFSFRGGVGTDITVLRYKGCPVNNAAKYSSGSVSFLPLISTMILSIGQGSDKKGNIVARRGAGIASINCTHPDLINFIKCKSNPDEVFGTDIFRSIPNDVSGLNLSVKVSDDFMAAVLSDDKWTLVWNGKPIQVVNARDIFELICKNAHASGDPGILFWDRCIENSTTIFDPKGTPAGVNPCGEQVLPKWGNCNLSAFNLLAFVNPTSREFDFLAFRRAVSIATEFADYIIDINNHPLPQQTKMDKHLRKVGLGILGLADALAAMGKKYSSLDGRTFGGTIMEIITSEAANTSVKLAEKYGNAPCLETKDQRINFTQQKFIQNLSEDLKHDIVKTGLRNSAFSTIAPTGTLAIVLGNLTSGCEPLFQREYYRKSRTTGKEHKIVHPPIIEFGIDPDAYETADEIHWKYRIAMQSALQEWTTDSISSTVNLPADTSIEDIYSIYEMAWRSDLKGITIYRDKSKDVQVLNKDNGICLDRPLDINYHSAPKRPKSLPCDIHFATAKGEKYVILVGKFNDKPYEVFAGLADALYIPSTCKEGEIIKNGKSKYSLKIKIRGIETEYHDIAKSLMNDKERLITRLLSLGLRHGIYLKFIIAQCKKATGSLVDFGSVIARILKKYSDVLDTVEHCPECGGKLTAESGCLSCKECGWSKCE